MRVRGTSLWVPAAAALLFAAASTASAQPAPGESTTATSVASVTTFAPSPDGFYRGNYPGSRGGGYLNLVGFLPALVLFFLWVKVAAWVNDDSEGLKVRPIFWNTAMFAAGVPALLMTLVMPSAFVGHLACMFLAGAPLGLYIAERNGRVPPSAQVMTPDHLGKVSRRLLAKIGIRIGSGEQIAADAGPPITFIGKSVTGESAEDRSAQVESSKGYMSARELVYDAIVRRATDVHLEPTEDEFAVRLRIDGVMQPGEAFSTDTGQAVLNVVKVLSAMDITERRKPQDGSFRAEVEGRRIDFRVATQGTGGGEKVSLRILDQGNTPIDLKRLGMRKSVLDPIMATLAQPHGLMIVCGPTGAGKSTTLYAALHTFDRTERNIITIEDPIEYRLGGINQIEIDRGAGQTFATTLRSVLRQDPDVVLVGEIRDAETAEIACQAANTGHLVLSTIHANDTLTALYRLVELGIDTHTVANALSAVVGQRLVRKLCPDCKIPYAVKPEAIERVGLSSQQVRRLFRAQQDANSICETCSGTGYLGRVGVFEVLTVTERIGEMVRERASLPAIRAEARKAGLKSMKEDGLRLAVKGLTSMDELLRVTK